MKIEKVREKLIAAIKSNFEIKNEDFIDDPEYGFIEMSIREDFDTHSDFNKRLEEILKKEFPDHKNPFHVDNCDSLEDVLCNNFGFPRG